MCDRIGESKRLANGDAERLDARLGCNPPNLVLIGFMGAGKTSVGRVCARRLRFRFTDTDLLVERMADKTIAQIFEEDGEEQFRHLEQIAVARISRRCGNVIATGGGVILNPVNVHNLRRNGVIIWLQTQTEEALRRVGDRSSRPLLSEAEYPAKRFEQLLVKRSPFYARAADYRLDSTGLRVSEAAESVIALYRKGIGL
ncbi:MAG: shikimate kinase [Armatimonadetes bacterium]|nr:shikimate kinase [Armatimonadota bacterium]